MARGGANKSQGRIALAADERLNFTETLALQLRRRGYDLKLFGALMVPPSPAASNVHAQAAREVAEGRTRFAVVCNWTGTGAAIAANQVSGIRAAYCTDAETARGARRWWDANVLALSLRLTSSVQLEEVLEAWLCTAPLAEESDGGETVASHTSTSPASATVDHLMAELEHGQSFREQVLAPLERYDVVRGTSLVDTLTVYCGCTFNLTRAAATLRVHPNTVLYRLRKVGELLGLDIRRPDDLLLLALAARASGGASWKTHAQWNLPHA